MPWVSVPDTLRLRSTAFPMSAEKPSKAKPHSSAFFSWFSSSAFLSRDLLGMQPQFRHTPPRPPIPVPSSFSTTAVLSPSCAPRMAAW